MDRTVLLELLALAERHVVQGERHLNRQREIVAETEAAGRDGALAREVLRTFEATQATCVADRDRLLKELEQASG
ncbi:hypothetical protein ABEV34_22305 [Methylorubrum rhodesianum]|jgi:hypothetical protein|uniref:Uncharacterized protein n=1 Tax=Methylorubrum rhodesianum TaxID=29427 RepID=A0ABU9ZHH3_9HYPH|nr:MULTISPECIES: hypothetical protein [Methylorubrum]MBB5761532.1 hypothetical protein [Methylorubrum rhodesianum]MBK3405698.1 hypothetical protein [Methylorubrum rhodesianum]MBY0139114.1 hypothetical protein [Methylorubrum populi]